MPTKHLSSAQIDRLGQRLRSQSFGEEDLTLLDEYRRTFGAGYDEVVVKIEQILARSVSGRPAKSTTSIIEKLNRESIRLSQMQDIAGCRVIVADVPEQDRAVKSIAEAFRDLVVVDRRKKPSHGYRAVHLIIRARQKPIEVQIRTSLQHLWAEMSEKFADMVDPALKYGGGPDLYREVLDKTAANIVQIENLEAGPRIAHRWVAIRNELVELLQKANEQLDKVRLEKFR